MLNTLHPSCLQEVIKNLMIARVMFCAEDDPDVRPYCHKRVIREEVVSAADELQCVLQCASDALRSILTKLFDANVRVAMLAPPCFYLFND